MYNATTLRLPRRLVDTGNDTGTSSLSESGSVQLKVLQDRLGVARGHAPVADLVVRSVLRHQRQLQLGLQPGFGGQLGVAGNVLQSLAGDLVLFKLKALELIAEHPRVHVAVLRHLELDGETEGH